MRSSSWLLVICVFGLSALQPQRLAAQADVPGANNAFAFDLYSRLRSQPGNIFVSPYSIETALGMTLAGARNETAKEMAAVLHLEGTPDQVQAGFGNWNQRLLASGQKDYQLNLANSLWAQQGTPFRSEFLHAAQKKYGAELKQTDFKKAPEEARQQINGWVAGKTQGKITDLIPPRVISESTRLVLANAIYFKASWQRQFDKSSTVNTAFHLVDGGAVMVPMMRQEHSFGYAQENDLQVLELPYVSDQISMLIILPRDPHSLDKVEQSLSATRVAQLLREIASTDVDVELPRFHFTSEFRLKDTLSQMGMPHAFEKCDFTGMSAEPTCIGAVLHKAYVDVNEAGTEAAAATAVTMDLTSSMNRPLPVPFHADHPFLFLIRDSQTNGILFLGRVANPGQ